MDILLNKERQTLLDYLTHVKISLKEWIFADVRLTEQSDKTFAISEAATLLQSHFEDKEGKIYICDDQKILMLLRWGKDRSAEHIRENIKKQLPEGSCEIRAYESTDSGLMKLELLMTCQKQRDAQSIAEIRSLRQENIIFVADDDMYMRLLVKKGITTPATFFELADGSDVLPAYKKHGPDILFLDIHLPHSNGLEILHDILSLDPDAYVVMLSADSSRENVEQAIRSGAKGFLTKPFTKDKLQAFIKKCPTIF